MYHSRKIDLFHSLCKELYVIKYISSSRVLVSLINYIQHHYKLNHIIHRLNIHSWRLTQSQYTILLPLPSLILWNRQAKWFINSQKVLTMIFPIVIIFFISLVPMNFVIYYPPTSELSIVFWCLSLYIFIYIYIYIYIWGALFCLFSLFPGGLKSYANFKITN